MRRVDALDERRAGTQQHSHFAAHPRLRGREQGLDVAAHRIEMLSLVHQIAVGLCDGLLDARLLAGEHQLLELAVRREQHLRRRRLEGDASLGADDGVAQMDAAADAVGARELLQLLDEGDRRQTLAVEARRDAGDEAQDVALGRARAA